MTINEGNYICTASNKAGKDESVYQIRVVPYFTSIKNIDSKITPAASSDSQISSYSKNKININESNLY